MDEHLKAMDSAVRNIRHILKKANPNVQVYSREIQPNELIVGELLDGPSEMFPVSLVTTSVKFPRFNVRTASDPNSLLLCIYVHNYARYGLFVRKEDVTEAKSALHEVERQLPQDP